MATTYNFGGKKIILPGAYSRVVSGRTNNPAPTPYGNVLIIDINNEVPGGSGVTGAKYQGKDSIYTFDSLQAFKDFCFQGVWWRAAEYLFTPNNSEPGAAQVSVIRPFTTTAALMTFTATGGGGKGGSFKVKTLDESTFANGLLSSTSLKSGYAYTIRTGDVDSAKWIFEIWRGTYRGDSTGVLLPVLPFDENELASTLLNPSLMVQSPEFNNIQTLIDWANTDEFFAKYFVLDSASAVVSTGDVNAADVSAVSGFNKATGGNSTQASGDMEAVFDAIEDINYNFIIAWDSSEEPSASTNVLKVKTFVNSASEYNPQLHTAVQIGSDDVIATAVATAASLNNDRVVLTFGSIFKASQLSPTKMVQMHPIFHLAYQVGRLAGLPSQVPLTNKALDILGLKRRLTKKEQIELLEAGVLCTIYDEPTTSFVVLQDVNTLQNNKYTLNADGTSHVIQYRRIVAELNADLKVNAKRDLLNNPLGVNRNTLSEADVKTFTEGRLQRRTATVLADNLILSFKNVKVTRGQDAYFVTYEFVANDEMRIVFFTGFSI